MEFSEIEKARWVFHRAVVKSLETHTRRKKHNYEDVERIVRYRLMGMPVAQIKKVCKIGPYRLYRLFPVYTDEPVVRAFINLARAEDEYLPDYLENPVFSGRFYAPIFRK